MITTPSNSGLANLGNSRQASLEKEVQAAGQDAWDLYQQILATGETPYSIAVADDLLQESAPDALDALVEATLSTHPVQVAPYRAGKRAVAGFLVGQVIKASGSRANPSAVDRLVRARLDAPGT